MQELNKPFGDDELLWIGLITFVLLCCYQLYRPVFLVSLLLLGYLGSHSSLPLLQMQSVQGVLVRLERDPQVQQIRDLRLSFIVLKTDPDSKLPEGSRLFCKSVSLVDNNANHLESGGYYLIAAKIQPLQIEKEGSYERSLFFSGYDATCELNFLAPLPSASKDWIQIFKERIITNAAINGFLDDATSLFLSMSIGHDQSLSAPQMDIFKGLGLAHLLVVSGFQVSLIFYFVRSVLSGIMSCSRRLTSSCNIDSIASVVAVLVSCFYARLVGFDAACTRAVIALCLLAITKILDRNVSFLNLICSTFFLDVILNPYCYRQPGSQLTYFALLGIALGHRQGAGLIMNLIRVNLYTTISTGIISIFWFDNFYLVSFFANLLIAPVVTVLSCQFGFIALLFLSMDYKLLFDLGVFLVFYLNELLRFLYESFSVNISSGWVLSLLVVLWLGICSYRFTIFLRNGCFR